MKLLGRMGSILVDWCGHIESYQSWNLYAHVIVCESRNTHLSCWILALVPLYRRPIGRHTNWWLLLWFTPLLQWGLINAPNFPASLTQPVIPNSHSDMEVTVQKCGGELVAWIYSLRYKLPTLFFLSRTEILTGGFSSLKNSFVVGCISLMDANLWNNDDGFAVCAYAHNYCGSLFLSIKAKW